MTEQPDLSVVQKSNRTISITIASIAAVFVVFILGLWAAGFFSFSGSDPSSKIVAAALALVGGLVAAVVSIVGILLKYSIDQRTESRLQIESNRAAAERKIESDRASALQTQAEQRLSLEAAIRAVELLGAEGSEGSIPLQRAGALFALSNLDQHQLTLNLTDYLLKKQALEPSIATSLIDSALKRGDESAQRQAALVLYDNAHRMATSSSTHAPRSITSWDACLRSAYVREIAVLALGRILLARPLTAWQTQFEEEANALMAALALAWRSESDERLKSDAGAILKSLLNVPSFSGQIFHPKGTIDLDSLKIEVAGCVTSGTRPHNLILALKTWGGADD